MRTNLPNALCHIMSCNRRVDDVSGTSHHHMRFVVFLALLALVAAGSTAPEQIHTAFAGSNGLSVSWFTLNATATSTLKWGLSADNLNQMSTGTSQSYGMPGFHHTVVIKGLASITKYFYSAGDAAGGFSAVFSVSTARAPSDPTPFTVSILGDMGTVDLNGAATTKALINTQAQSDFIWHVGDLSYADDTIELFYEATWNKYMNGIQPAVANQAYMVLPGNHEATCTEVLPFQCPMQHRNFTAYRTRFRMPWAESGGVNNMWHSFDYGLVHFISISTETDFTGAPEGPNTWINAGPFGNQMQWLINDLQKAVANRANVPWIIVGGHRPVYSSRGVTQAVHDMLEPLLLQYNVDFYFCGHVHWYERMYPVAQGNVLQKDYNNPASPVYIVSGSAGNVEGPPPAGSSQPYTAYLNRKNFGYGRLTVHNASSATWSYYRADDQMNLDDQITVTKQR